MGSKHSEVTYVAPFYTIGRMAAFFFIFQLFVPSVLSFVSPGQPDTARCPTSCVCQQGSHGPNTAIRQVVCTMQSSRQWLEACRQLEEYAKHHATLDLKLKSSSTKVTHESLKCLPPLRSLDLSQMGEYILNINATKDVVTKHLNVSGNFFSALPPLKDFVVLNSLESLDLSHNSLNYISADFLSNATLIKFLDLSYNKIQHVSLNTLSHLTDLEVLNLENNQLYELTLDHLPPTSNLKTLNLRANLLSSFILGYNVSSNMTLGGLTSLDISENPLQCSCVLGSLLNELPSLKQVLMNKENTACASPPNLEGQLLYNISVSDLTCVGPKNIISYPSKGHGFPIYHRITLECSAEGYPSPDILWITPWGDKFFSGSHLSLLSQDPVSGADNLAESRRYWDPHVFLESTLQFTTNQSLEIDNYRGSFAGEYTCIAMNVAGNSTRRIDISAHSKMKSVYLHSIFIGCYCASGFLIFGFLVGGIRNLIVRLRNFKFKAPIFSKSPSIHPPEEDVVSAEEENTSGNGASDDNDDSDKYPPSPPPPPFRLPLWHTVLAEEETGHEQKSPKPGGPNSPWGWPRPPDIFGSLEEARGRLRYGVGRRMDHLRKSLKESSSYVHSIKESGTTAASKVKASMAHGVETVKWQVQSFRELCGTGNMGTHTISMMSVETDVDTNERKDIIRQVTFV